jgi:ADP-ribosylglycohydrolase
MDTQFEIAKNEYFLEETDNNKVKLVYAYFGSSIYHGQCLEETFSMMLITDKIFKKALTTNAEINEIVDTIENS